MRLTGKVAIVTGAGRGIGRAIALALAAEGAAVTVCARTVIEINAVVAEITQQGQRALAIPADVTVAAQVQAMVARTVAELGGLDILVNNAGGAPSEIYEAAEKHSVLTPLWEIPEANWDRMIASNLKSAFLCLKAVMPQFVRQQQGEVVNIGSQTGRIPFPMEGSYPTAKAGLVALTTTAALQAAASGVRINMVSPGLIDTPGQRRLMRELLPEDQFPPMDSAASVAAAVLYLLCDAPKSMTGQSLDIFKVVGS